MQERVKDPRSVCQKKEDHNERSKEQQRRASISGICSSCGGSSRGSVRIGGGTGQKKNTKQNCMVEELISTSLRDCENPYRSGLVKNWTQPMAG
jgi:hypothetical protein